ncbi:hypothetical protein D3C87_1464730 [compost metagenome]
MAGDVPDDGAGLGTGSQADGNGCIPNFSEAVFDDQLGHNVGLLKFRVCKDHAARCHQQRPALFRVARIQDASQIWFFQRLTGGGRQVVNADCVVVRLLIGILRYIECHPNRRQNFQTFCAAFAHQEPVDTVKPGHQRFPPRRRK